MRKCGEIDNYGTYRPVSLTSIVPITLEGSFATVKLSEGIWIKLTSGR